MTDNAEGRYESTDVYSDLDIPKIESLADTQPHRVVDRTIVAAEEEGNGFCQLDLSPWLNVVHVGYARTWIVLPSTIWGLADNVFVKEGLQNPQSQQIPGMIKLAISLGKAVYVGEGKNIWPHVHIDEGAKFVSVYAV